MTRPDVKEGHVEIGGLLDQERIVGVLRLHPLPERRTHSEQWHEEQRHHRQKAGHVFQLPADDYAPLGIHRMMHKRPEESAHANGEKKRVSKEVGKGELLHVEECPYEHHNEGQHTHPNQTEKTTPNMLVVEKLRLRIVAGRLTHLIAIPI